jgi:RNA polymerase sigma-70 factor (ECF subfamily)
MVQKANHDEMTLVEKAKVDPEAFSALYERYFQRIYSYVSWRIGSRRDVEDLVSDIFTKALDKLSSFKWQKGATFSSWIFRIAHNAVVDYYRSKGKRRHVDLDDLPEIESSGLLPSEALDRRRLFETLSQMIQELPTRQAEIITMRFFGEMRNKEIAKILDIEERSVSSSLFRGLKKLHDMLN